MNIKIDCKQASRLFSDLQEHELPAAEHARLRLHLVLCEACRNVDEQMRFMRRAMRELGQREPPPK